MWLKRPDIWKLHFKDRDSSLRCVCDFVVPLPETKMEIFESFLYCDDPGLFACQLLFQML